MSESISARKWRTRIACGIALVSLPALSCKEASQKSALPQPTGPSVLLITMDTTRADHLGCYGYGKPISPNLDRFAETGTLFTDAISQAAVTPVSRASILTGLDPYSHGLRVMHGLTENRLSDSYDTCAEVLQLAGYNTAAFVSAFPVSERFGLHQGFDEFDADFMHGPSKQFVTAKGTVETGLNQRRADETTSRALDWLSKQADPFFLWVHYFDPHDPLLLPPGVDSSKFSGTLSKVLREFYDLEIQYMDQQMGRIFQELSRSGKLDEMVVIVVADHGEGLGDHNWWTHGILYQEQIRVPLIIRTPLQSQKRRIDHSVRLIDIMPTVLELVGLDGASAPSMDGTSLVPLLEGDPPDYQCVAYSDSVNMLTYRFMMDIEEKKDEMLFAIVDRPWKYIHHLLRREESELYNLADDPDEQHNLMVTHPEQAARLLAVLQARDFMPGPDSQRGRMSSEDVERLRSLGYVD